MIIQRLFNSTYNDTILTTFWSSVGICQPRTQATPHAEKWVLGMGSSLGTRLGICQARQKKIVSGILYSYCHSCTRQMRTQMFDDPPNHIIINVFVQLEAYECHKYSQWRAFYFQPKEHHSVRVEIQPEFMASGDLAYQALVMSTIREGKTLKVCEKHLLQLNPSENLYYSALMEEARFVMLQSCHKARLSHKIWLCNATCLFPGWLSWLHSYDRNMAKQVF